VSCSRAGVSPAKLFPVGNHPKTSTMTSAEPALLKKRDLPTIADFDDDSVRHGQSRRGSSDSMMSAVACRSATPSRTKQLSGWSLSRSTRPIPPPSRGPPPRPVTCRVVVAPAPIGPTPENNPSIVAEPLRVSCSRAGVSPAKLFPVGNHPKTSTMTSAEPALLKSETPAHHRRL